MLVFGDYQARLLGTRSGQVASIETYALEKRGETGQAFAQVELFRGPAHAQWHAWEGPNWRHRAILKELEAARNIEP